MKRETKLVKKREVRVRRVGKRRWRDNVGETRKEEKVRGESERKKKDKIG